MSCTDPLRLSPRARRNGVCAAAARTARSERAGPVSDTSWPTMRVMSCMRVSSPTGYSPTRWPLRSTVTRSEISNICSRKWVMKRMAIPWPLSRRITEKSIFTSSSARLEVGSSRMRILARVLSARAIATICCTAIEKLASGADTSTWTFRSDRSASALRLISRQRMARALARSRPRKTFSATDRFGHRFTSW
jgi:hypothetical protein